MRLRKTEIIAIFVGTGLFLGSIWLFSLETESILAWMGMDRYAKRPKVAEVEVIRNMVRKKEYEMPEFRSVERRQTVYGKDSVMTGNGSAAVLHFLDGTVIELGPDTLVQVETRGAPDAMGNFELLLDVKKGEVTGQAASKKVKVIKGRDVVALAPPKKESLAVAIIEKKPIEKPTDCRFVSTFSDKAQAVALLKCDEGATQKTIQVKSSDGRILDEKLISIAPNHTAKWNYAIQSPGTYEVQVVQKETAQFSFKVQEREQTLTWDENPILCGETLKYRTGKRVPQKVILESSDGRVLLDAGKANGGLISKPGYLKAPLDVRVVEEFLGGFKDTTPILSVPRWRVCPILRTPANGSSEKSVSGRGVLFTWVSMGSSEEYVFELSKSSDFSKPIYSKRVQMNLLRFDPPVRGRLYWRIIDVSSKESSSIFQVVVK
jgi:hypothetical protein